MRKQRLTLLAELAVALSAFVGIVYLTNMHIRFIAEARSVSIPLLASISTLEREQQVVQEQLELAQLESLDRTTQLQEQVQTYVLDSEQQTTRTVQVLETFIAASSEANTLQLRSPLRMGEAHGATTFSLQADMHRSAWQDLQALLELSGKHTVYDALTTQQRALLIQQTESLSPEAILELEDFFAVPLSEFIQNTDAYIQTLLRSFSGKQFESMLQTVLQSGPIAGVITLADSTTQAALQAKNAWPYPLMQVHTLSLTPSSVKDWQTVSITVILPTL